MLAADAAESTELPAGAKTGLPSMLICTRGPKVGAAANPPDFPGWPGFHQRIAVTAASMISPVTGLVLPVVHGD